MCHSMSTPRRGHRDPVTDVVTVPVSVQDPLRASSSNSSNRAQPQNVNWQARSNYMQQATSRLPEEAPACPELQSGLWPSPFSSFLHTLLPPLATPLPYPGPCSYKIISFEINKLKPVGRTGNEGLCDSSYQSVESARGSEGKGRDGE